MSRKFKGLVKRFTKKQAELAQRISNDLAENINPYYASREDIKMAVAYWADMAAVNARNKVQSDQEMALVISGIGLIQSAVGSFNKRMEQQAKELPK